MHLILLSYLAYWLCYVIPDKIQSNVASPFILLYYHGNYFNEISSLVTRRDCRYTEAVYLPLLEISHVDQMIVT